MTSKTHIAASAAVTMAVMQPTTIKDVAICLAASTIGGIISDVDVTTSESRKDLAKIITISVIAIAACVAVERLSNIGISQLIMSQTLISNAIIGFLAFLLVCIYGTTKPHRTFMHSIPGVVILSLLVEFMFPAAAPAFAIGMLTHIFLDLFNRRKVQLFYPLKFKFAFKLCKADGKVNNLLCLVFTVLFIAEMTLFTVNHILPQW